MSNPWPMVPLGEVLKKSEEWMDLKPGETYREVTVKLWGKGVVLRREVTGAEIAASRRLVVRRQQFILSRIDARNGAFGLIPDSLDKAVVSNDFPVFNLDTQRVEPKFLEWISKTPDFVGICKAASEGTTNRVRLKEERFLASQIPLPPLSEQKRIVARIEELAAKIEEAKGLRQKAVEETESLILSSLMHFNSHPHWERKLISDCSEMSTGTTPPSDRTDYFGGPLQWYTPGDLKYQRQLGRSSRTLSEAAVRDGKARLFSAGTVLLVAIGGSLGKVGIAHEQCSANQQITGIKFNTEIQPEYGFWWMRRLGKDLMAAAPQATLPIINQTRIGQFQLVIPPLPDQRRIVAYLDGLQAKVDALKQLQVETAKELNAMLPSVLDRAFRGEL